MNTKIAIKEKLLSVEERIGILNMANPKIQADKSTSTMNSIILSRITSTITNMNRKSNTIDDELSVTNENTEYLMNNFKQLGQHLAHIAVTCAILVKKSPLPGKIPFYEIQVIHMYIYNLYNRYYLLFIWLHYSTFRLDRFRVSLNGKITNL